MSPNAKSSVLLKAVLHLNIGSDHVSLFVLQVQCVLWDFI